MKKYYFIALGTLPFLFISAKSLADTGISTVSLASSALMAKEPMTVKPEISTSAKEDINVTRQEILMTPQKDVVGGSPQQVENISPYLGKGY